MPQIYQRQSLGELLGSGLGQGVGAGLQQLAQHKLQEMTHRQQQLKSAQAFRDLGFGNESMALSMLPEKLQSDIIKNYWQRGGGAGGAEQQQAQGLEQLLNMQSQVQQPQQESIQQQLGQEEKEVKAPVNLVFPSQQPQSELNTLLTSLKQPNQLLQQNQQPEPQQKLKSIERWLPELLGSKSPINPQKDAVDMVEREFNKDLEAKKAARQLIKNQERADKILASGKRVPDALAQSIQRQESVLQQASAQPSAGGRMPTIAEVLSRPYESPEMKQKERHFQAQEERADKKEQALEKREAIKLTEGVRKDAVEQAQSAQRTLHDLDRIEELSQSGKLDTPGYVEFLHRSGLDIPALMNPESEEFAKLQQGFLRDAKQYFGGRVSNYEVEQFLKTIPSLSQSPEGRNRVIANLKYLSRAKLEHFKTLRDIIKDNKGLPPYDLAEQAFEKQGPKLSALAKKFKQDLQKPVPASQNKLVTGLQSIGGTVAGRIPQAAAGAALGAYFGGPLGAALGGLGGLSGVNLKGLIG